MLKLGWFAKKVARPALIWGSWTDISSPCSIRWRTAEGSVKNNFCWNEWENLSGVVDGVVAVLVEPAGAFPGVVGLVAGDLALTLNMFEMGTNALNVASAASLVITYNGAA